MLRKWGGSAKMAQEGEFDSCAAEGLNFNMTPILQYGLIGFFIILLVLGLGIGLIVVVGWILYRTFGTVPSAVPYAGARESPPEGTAPLKGHRHLAASSFSIAVTIAYLNHITF